MGSCLTRSVRPGLQEEFDYAVCGLLIREDVSIMAMVVKNNMSAVSTLGTLNKIS